MKRISKRRLRELREFATGAVGSTSDAYAPSDADLLALLDAYERRPDEVADETLTGYVTGQAVHDIISSTDQYEWGDAECRRVRVEVYYLKPKGAKR